MSESQRVALARLEDEFGPADEVNDPSAGVVVLGERRHGRVSAYWMGEPLSNGVGVIRRGRVIYPDGSWRIL